MNREMTPERWRQVKALLDEVLERAPAERDAFLSEACRDNPLLQSAVESLLLYQEQSELFSAPSDEATTKQFFPKPEPPTETGKRLGQYKIVRELAHGGMGAVYLATRADDQYRQQVAIKLIRQGMDSDFALRRFRTERQILAALDHPNIARLLDGGTTEDGAPYLVMEYIEGVPINEYCETHKLSTEARLQLFRQVCAAVHYAHQHLVIHRDLKPSNILVTAEGTPKLLDFGIAKLLTPELAAQTIDPTAPALRMMTPAYASPEQVRGDTITTASDVYSLGVILYELLTGSSPYKSRPQAMPELLQAICTEEPVKPSSIRTEKGSAEAKVSPSPFLPFSPSQLSGDLDNIALMALRKEPLRRYASVEQFSEDIRRHLEGFPILGRGDSFGYVAAKFIRRNRVAVGIAALLVVSLITGMVLTLRAQRRAEQRFNDIRKLARAVVFDYHDAIADLAGATPVRQRLVKDALEYLDSLADEAGNDQSLQRELATAYRKIGDVQGNANYANLGDTQGALASYHKALAIRTALAAALPQSAEAQTELAEIHERLGDVLWDRNELSEASQQYNQMVTLLERLSNAASTDAERKQKLAKAYTSRGNLKGNPYFANLGDPVGGLADLQRAHALREAFAANTPGNLDVQYALQASHRSLADLLDATGDFRSAEQHIRQALSIADNLVKAEPSSVRANRTLMICRGYLGYVLTKLGQLPEAEAAYLQALTASRTALAGDPTNKQARRDLMISLSDVSDILIKLGDPQGALKQQQEALALAETAAASDPANADARRSLAIRHTKMAATQIAAHDSMGALRSQRTALTICTELAQQSPNNATALRDVAGVYQKLGELLLQTGALSESVEPQRQTVVWSERALALNPTSDSARALTATACFTLAERLRKLTPQTGLATTPGAKQMRDACQFYQRSDELFRTMKTAGTLTNEQRQQAEQASAALVRCGAMQPDKRR